MNSPPRRLFWLSLLLILGVAAPAFAATGGEVSLPTPGRKNPSKLRLTINDRGVDAPGYRTLKITASAWAPVVDERSLRIVLYPNRTDPFDGYDQAVTGYVEIPAGAASGQVTLLVPQAEPWHSMMVDVFEDGRRLNDVSEVYRLSRTGGNYYGEMPGILFIDRDVPPRGDRENSVRLQKQSAWKGKATHDLPDFRGLLSVFPSSQNNWGNPVPNAVASGDDNRPKAIQDIELLSLVADQQLVEMLPFAELPTQWLELSCYDVVFINREDLSELAAKHPARFKALRDWLATGPVLCVYDGGGDSLEHLEEIEKTLRLQVSPTTTEEENIRGWRLPSDQAFDGAMTQPRMRNYYGGYYNSATIASAGGNRPKVSAERKRFVTCHADLGKVVVWKDKDLFSRGDNQWLAFLNTVSPTHWHGSTRQGVFPHGSNPHYWEFLIPGVGEAPVMSFVILITLFMIAIGPVNYWVVRRLQRSYLLLITVPAGALLVTCGLFSYALLTEGFQVRSRLRSYTWLDSQQGRATSISRQSYYASLTPSAGLLYPADEAVFPLVANAEQYNRSSFGREMIWEDAGQRLKSNYLYPRTVAQFMVVGTHPSEARLDIRGNKGNLTGRQVVNQLGCRIKYLKVFDEAGMLLAEDIPAGETATLETKWSDAKFKWDEFVDSHQPKEPAEYNPTRMNLMRVIFGGPMGFNNFTGGNGDDLSLLELRLNKAKEKGSPGSFVAIIERPEAVSLGLKHSHEKASFHLLQGNW